VTAIEYQVVLLVTAPAVNLAKNDPVGSLNKILSLELISPKSGAALIKLCPSTAIVALMYSAVMLPTVA
tara:strand:- start:46 stop:252 length:207 start_codon:yes stop_codon:yes gene_type:complete